ncbi:hypothetical protein [Thermogutta terrifontis]|uniref:hypothetical protein n=1 Tax=Thermogutta terrifontis TaxID=1331910 RepID=UPI0012FDBDD3|nr:hypothetical protein [Thermogutta terrifontis]
MPHLHNPMLTELVAAPGQPTRDFLELPLNADRVLIQQAFLNSLQLSVNCLDTGFNFLKPLLPLLYFRPVAVDVLLQNILTGIEDPGPEFTHLGLVPLFQRLKPLSEHAPLANQCTTFAVECLLLLV